MRRDQWLMIGTALILPTLTLRLAPGPPVAGHPGPATEEAPWTLPALPSVDTVQSAYEHLRMRQSAIPAGAAPAGTSRDTATTPLLTDSDWRLRGVIQADGRRYALIETTAGKTRRYRVGELLPRGEKLWTVQQDRIEIRNREGMEVRVLYRQDTVSTGKP